MLGKLIKYELKATGRILIPLYLVLLAFAVVNKIFIGTGFTDKASGLGVIPFLLSILGYSFTMAAVFVVTFFVIIQRFYKNLLGDEGYLMNTLPISTISNITNKILVATIWNIISGFVAILSIVIMAFKPTDFGMFFGEFFHALSQAYNELGVQFFLLLLEFIAFVLVWLFKFISMIYASISIGHLFSKHRILSSFGAFIGLNFIAAIITYFIGVSFSNLRFLNIHLESIGAAHGIMTLLIAYDLVFFIAYFVITNYILKNKLNLE